MIGYVEWRFLIIVGSLSFDFESTGLFFLTLPASCRLRVSGKLPKFGIWFIVFMFY